MDDYREKLREYSRKLDEELHDKGFKRDLAARFVVIWTLLSRIPLPKEWWPETVPEGNRALALAPLAGGLLGLLTGLVVSAASVLGLNALAGAWVAPPFIFSSAGRSTSTAGETCGTASAPDAPATGCAR